MPGRKTYYRTINTLFLALCSIGIMTPAEANSYQYCGGGYASLEGFNAKTNDTLLNSVPYAIGDRFNSNTQSDQLVYFNVKPEYDWGFRAAIGYDFPSCKANSNYGLSLEYTHLKNDLVSTTPRFEDDSDSEIDAFLVSGYNFDGDFQTARNNINTKYDTVDLLGHKNFRCNDFNVQVFSGGRFLRLDERLNANFKFIDDFSTRDYRIRESNLFKGVGPRLGANAFYPIIGGFGLTGEIAGMLIYGTTESEYLLNDDTVIVIPEQETLTFANETRNAGHEKSHFITALSGKLGLVYQATFCNRSVLSLEAGYRGDKYFGITDHSAFVNSLSFVSGTDDPADLSVFNKDANYHDFEVVGPYLSLTYHI